MLGEGGGGEACVCVTAAGKKEGECLWVRMCASIRAAITARLMCAC